MKRARRIISIVLALLMVVLAMPIAFAVNEDPIGGTMLYDFEYTTDAAEAAASDGKLQWIPSFELPVFDNKNKPEGKTHYERAEEWRQEGYPLYAWPNAKLEKSAMNATVVSAAEGEPVLFGNHSLKVEVDFSGYEWSSNCNCYIRTTDPDHYFEGMPKKLGAWIYVPEGMANFALYLQCSTKDLRDSDGIHTAYAPVSMNWPIAKNWVGWKYVEIDLTNAVSGSAYISPTSYPYGYYQGCGIFWISFQAGIFNGAREKATVYLDNIQLIYDENTKEHLLDAGEITTQPCVKPGVFTYTCQDCDLTVTREIPALGYHFPGTAAVENETESTCAVAGGFDTVVRCTRCNEIISSEHTAYPLSEPQTPDESEKPTDSAKGGSLISKFFAWLIELFNMFTRWIQK